MTPEEFRAEVRALPKFVRATVIELQSPNARGGRSYGAALFACINARIKELKPHADQRVHRMLDDIYFLVDKASRAFYSAAKLDVPALCEGAAQRQVDEILKALEAPKL